MEAIRYDADRREIGVRYRSGRAYAYAHADRRMFRELLTADSIGAYVNTVLKPGRPCRELA